MLAACSGEPINQTGNTTGQTGGATNLGGLGASFPNPIYQKWVSEYGKINPNIKIDYQSQGSSAGIKAVINQNADFGASDAPMTNEELAQAKSEILHIPTVLGAVVLTYNVEGLSAPLRLSPQTVVDIFLGKIKRWNDEKIKADNAGANLPDKEITVVYRSDGSGTTHVFNNYLGKVSPDWTVKGQNMTLPQGVGLGAQRNDGVMGQVKQTPNTIGYVELTFAKANNLPSALIKNAAGNFVEATLESVTAAAAETAKTAPDDLRVDITNAGGANAYPISSYTYILAHKDQRDAAKGKALADFLWWATHEGQAFAKDLHYSTLTPEVVTKVEARLKTMSYGGVSNSNRPSATPNQGAT
ncbi:MAG TPA: phosphate ABC transporter substrate-binding protein PstS, partial [Pyrinomonadaceae bacterium]|nr:phosphate ABC transporter substrate-binding protein PstS [Pyrinomonadaceae bacterium]